MVEEERGRGRVSGGQRGGEDGKERAGPRAEAAGGTEAAEERSALEEAAPSGARWRLQEAPPGSTLT